MDEEEIQQRYDEEKEKAMEDYLKDVEEKKFPREKLQEIYKDQLKKAMDKYNKDMAKSIDKKEFLYKLKLKVKIKMLSHKLTKPFAERLFKKKND